MVVASVQILSFGSSLEHVSQNNLWGGFRCFPFLCFIHPQKSSTTNRPMVGLNRIQQSILGCPRESINVWSMKEGDEVSFHVNIHVSCYTDQFYTLGWSVMLCMNPCVMSRHPRSGRPPMVGLTELRSVSWVTRDDWWMKGKHKKWWKPQIFT